MLLMTVAVGLLMLLQQQLDCQHTPRSAPTTACKLGQGGQPGFA